MSPEPIHKRVSSGTHCIKSEFGSFIEQPNQNQQTQQQIILSRLEKRALNSLKLVEKVESIGLHNIISSPSNQLSFGFACSSPKRIIQLATLNRTSNAIIDEVHFDRDQIKGVLSRGLTISGSKCKSDTTNCVRNKFHLKEDSFTNANKAIDLKKLNRTQNISQTHSSLRKHISRQKVRKELKNCIALQRPDLGTIVSLVGKDVGDSPKIKNELCVQSESKVEFKHQENQCTQSFVGSVSSLLFGRKGGWF